MGFGRTNAQKKQHKERSQPFNRQRYGLLEKKKDYVLRAVDYKQKQVRLKTLRSKVANKNEDEFYFGMIKGKTKNGVAIADRGNTALGQAVTKILKTQDTGYITTMASIERKKIEALRQLQHLPDLAQVRHQTLGQQVESDDDDEDDESSKKRANKKARHEVYVDSVTDLESFSAPDSDPTVGASVAPKSAESGKAQRLLARQNQRAKLAVARQLESRQARLAKLEVAVKETELHRQLQTKGARKKIGVDKDGVARYKWKQERKR